MCFITCCIKAFGYVTLKLLGANTLTAFYLQIAAQTEDLLIYQPGSCLSICCLMNPAVSFIIFHPDFIMWASRGHTEHCLQENVDGAFKSHTELFSKDQLLDSIQNFCVYESSNSKGAWERNKYFLLAKI